MARFAARMLPAAAAAAARAGYVLRRRVQRGACSSEGARFAAARQVRKSEKCAVPHALLPWAAEPEMPPY
jgi:hypothetical protein